MINTQTHVLRFEVIRDTQTGKLRRLLVKMVRCGKRHCHKCPHGPYLYERVRSRRTRSGWSEQYLGSERSERVRAIYAAQLAAEAGAEMSRS